MQDFDLAQTSDKISKMIIEIGFFLYYKKDLIYPLENLVLPITKKA